MSFLWNRQRQKLERDNAALREELSAANAKAERERLMKEQALRENAVLLRKNRELRNQYESVLHLRYEMERIFNEIHKAADKGESLDKRLPAWLDEIDEAAKREWGKLPLSGTKAPIPRSGIALIDMLVETSVRDAQNCGVVVSGAYDGNAARLIAAGMSEQDAEVLRSLGKEKVTTHPWFGEGGISLLLTLDVLKKCKGSFVIDETPRGSYKKRVSVRMDGLSQFIVVSSREDVKRVCEARQDILLREPE